MIPKSIRTADQPGPLWEQIEQIRAFATQIIENTADATAMDEWHQFKEVADVHLETAEEPDVRGLYEVNIYVYPLMTNAEGDITTDTSNGILLF